MKHVKIIWLCMVLISLYGFAKLLNKMSLQKCKKCFTSLISEQISMKFCIQKSFRHPRSFSKDAKATRPKVTGPSRPEVKIFQNISLCILGICMWIAQIFEGWSTHYCWLQRNQYQTGHTGQQCLKHMKLWNFAWPSAQLFTVFYYFTCRFGYTNMMVWISHFSVTSFFIPALSTAKLPRSAELIAWSRSVATLIPALRSQCNC